MILRGLLIIGALGFIALLVATMINEGSNGLEALTGAPWGRVTLVDFYLGVLCFVAVIWTVERAPVATLLWTGALMVLGNPVAVAWLLLRGLPRLQRHAADSGARHLDP